jgi:hypothetical protein
MSQYLTFGTYRDYTLAPASYVEQVENEEPNWINKQLALISSLIDAKLAKRYATPFDVDSPPALILDWTARLMNPRLYFKRGIDPADRQVSEMRKDAERAWEEIIDAADSKDGLTELPLRADLPGSTGIVKASPLSYTETSPYQWSVWQAEEDRDDSGRGYR